MKREYAVRVRFIVVQGIIMLCLGAVLSQIAEVMCSHPYSKIPYYMALTAIGIVSCEMAFASYRAQWVSSTAKIHARLFIVTGILVLIGIGALRIGHSVSLSVSSILLMSGVLGLFCGVLNIALAYRMSVFRKTSAALAGFGATLSASGAVLCALSDMSSMTATTVAACYSTWIGFGMLSLAPVLFWNWRSRDGHPRGARHKVQVGV